MEKMLVNEKNETTKGSSNSRQNALAGQKPDSNAARVKKIVNRLLTAPETVSGEEFILVQAALGYGKAKSLLEQGKQRKKQMKHNQGMAGNSTGLPLKLKEGVESLSGFDLSEVRVTYNSAKPMQVGAAAYTKGTEIHVSPGQEQSLPHEAWHVVQQAQGRVKPTGQVEGLDINNDPALETEASSKGEQAERLEKSTVSSKLIKPNMGASLPAQMNWKCKNCSRKVKDESLNICPHCNAVRQRKITERPGFEKKTVGEVLGSLPDDTKIHLTVATQQQINDSGGLKAGSYWFQFGEVKNYTVRKLQESGIKAEAKGYTKTGIANLAKGFIYVLNSEIAIPACNDETNGCGKEYKCDKAISDVKHYVSLL